jgi:hypothetical protein
MYKNNRQSNGEKKIMEIKTGISQDLTRTQYIDKICAILFTNTVELPSLKGLKLKEAKDLANHLMTLKTEVKSVQ